MDVERRHLRGRQHHLVGRVFKDVGVMDEHHGVLCASGGRHVVIRCLARQAPLRGLFDSSTCVDERPSGVPSFPLF